MYGTTGASTHSFSVAVLFGHFNPDYRQGQSIRLEFRTLRSSGSWLIFYAVGRFLVIVLRHFSDFSGGHPLTCTPLPPTIYRLLDVSGQTITLGHRECVEIKYKQTEETYESFTYGCKRYYATGTGNVRVENSSTKECVNLEFRVGGPENKTQIIFIDYYKQDNRARELKRRHGICVNRQDEDTRIRFGKEVLGDIAFIDRS